MDLELFNCPNCHAEGVLRASDGKCPNCKHPLDIEDKQPAPDSLRGRFAWMIELRLAWEKKTCRTNSRLR